MNLRKSNRGLAWVIFLSMLIVSCTGNKRYDQLLAKADSVMNVDDDSAKVAVLLVVDFYPVLSWFISQVDACESLWKFW